MSERILQKLVGIIAWITESFYVDTLIYKVAILGMLFIAYEKNLLPCPELCP